MSDTISGTCRACGEPITLGDAFPLRGGGGSPVWVCTARCYHCDKTTVIEVEAPKPREEASCDE